jgi:hypothetical protein
MTTAGRINPRRITVALDRAGLVGPTADAKVGAQEPALDMWEAGQAVPTRAQLERLAELSRIPVDHFWLPDNAAPRILVAFLCDRSKRNGGITLVSLETDPYPEIPRPPVQRHQRKRSKGWTMPDRSVYVGRPGAWGNPFRVDEHGREEAVRLYREALEAGLLRYDVDDVRKRLAGRDLVCWCPIGDHCHGDVLLEIANAS